jgi:hypothetical protein
MKAKTWVLAALLCGLTAVPGAAATLTFVTSLKGSSEAPPNDSPATGSGKVTVDFHPEVTQVFHRELTHL